MDAGTFRHTTAIRTAIDIATRHGFREGLVAMDCLVANQHHRRDIVTAIGNLSRTRNIATARRVVKHAVSNSRSPYESFARAVLIGEGYVGVRANARVGPYEADLLCGPLIWEIDGDITYDGVTYRPTAEMIRYEREREKDLQNMGYIVRRITPSQLLRNEQEFLFLTRLALRGATPPASPDLPPPPR